MSAATEKSQMSGTVSSNLLSTPMDIPVVNINVPDYPDREPRSSTGATTRGPLNKSLGPQQKQGLTAPLTDISCSGPKILHKSNFIHFNAHKKFLSLFYSSYLRFPPSVIFTRYSTYFKVLILSIHNIHATSMTRMWKVPINTLHYVQIILFYYSHIRLLYEI